MTVSLPSLLLPPSILSIKTISFFPYLLLPGTEELIAGEVVP